MENVTLIPGWMKSVKFYGDYQGPDIWKGISENKIKTDCVVAHSLGCNYLFSECELKNVQQIILVNPLIPKRGVISWMYRWIKYALSGALAYDKQNSFIYFPYAFLRYLLIVNVDIIKKIELFGKDKVVVVRGSRDKYFCDDVAAKNIRASGITLFEADNLGHEWCKEYDSAVKQFIKQK